VHVECGREKERGGVHEDEEKKVRSLGFYREKGGGSIGVLLGRRKQRWHQLFLGKKKKGTSRAKKTNCVQQPVAGSGGGNKKVKVLPAMGGKKGRGSRKPRRKERKERDKIGGEKKKGNNDRPCTISI